MNEKRTIDHPYSPSTTPSVDGTGCLWRERLADGTYSLRTCQQPEALHVAADDEAIEVAAEREQDERAAELKWAVR